MIKFAIIFSLFLAVNPITYVSEVNDTQKKALIAFNDKDYLIAIYRYEYLVEKLQVKDLNVYLNLAHSYYKAQKWQEAKRYYTLVAKGKNTQLASLAYHQLGMISDFTYNKDSSIEDLRNALKYFKFAIKNNSQNTAARYNYELLRKKLEELRKMLEKKNPRKNKKSGKSGKNKRKGGRNKQSDSEGEGDGDEKERSKKEESKEGKDQINKEDEKGKEDGSKTNDKKGKDNTMRSDKLKAININQEKIKTIFEAMKNKEIQYLQQKRRRNKKGKKGYGKNKPDW